MDILGQKSHMESQTTHINRNGKLILDTAKAGDMQILNDSKWQLDTGEIIESEGFYTYHKHRVDGQQTSIIDYAIVDKNLLPSIKKFRIMDNAINIPTSDHIPLLIHMQQDEVNTTEINDQESETQYNTNWESYKKQLEAKVKGDNQDFKLLNIQEQTDLLTESIHKALLSTSTKKKVVKTKKEKNRKLPSTVKKYILLRKNKLKEIRRKIRDTLPYQKDIDELKEAKLQEQLERIKHIGDRRADW